MNIAAFRKTDKMSREHKRVGLYYDIIINLLDMMYVLTSNLNDSTVVPCIFADAARIYPTQQTVLVGTVSACPPAPKPNTD